MGIWFRSAADAKRYTESVEQAIRDGLAREVVQPDGYSIVVWKEVSK